MLFVINVSFVMVLWGGCVKSIGMNLWLIVVLGGCGGVVVMDIVNIVVVCGKIYFVVECGVDILNIWVVDENGVLMINVKDVIYGLILFMVGYKGYVIFFMMDVFVGVLMGSYFGLNVVGLYEVKKISGCGYFLIIIDVKLMMLFVEFE